MRFVCILIYLTPSRGVISSHDSVWTLSFYPRFPNPPIPVIRLDPMNMMQASPLTVG